MLDHGYDGNRWDPDFSYHFWIMGFVVVPYCLTMYFLVPHLMFKKTGKSLAFYLGIGYVTGGLASIYFYWRYLDCDLEKK